MYLKQLFQHRRGLHGLYVRPAPLHPHHCSPGDCRYHQPSPHNRNKTFALHLSLGLQRLANVYRTDEFSMPILWCLSAKTAPRHPVQQQQLPHEPQRPLATAAVRHHQPSSIGFHKVLVYLESTRKLTLYLYFATDWSPVPLHHSLVKHDRVWESSHDQWSAHLSDHDRVTRWSRSTSNATRGSKQTDTHNIKLAHEDGSKTHVRIVLINGRRHSTEWRRDEPVLSTAEQLEEYADIYGPGMVAFCKARIGQRVGNGECWTLARDAVDSVGAREVLGRNYGQMVQRFLAKPGDVLEFKQCRFEWTEGRSTHWMEAGHPNHTAIIYRVEGGGNVFHVYEQNVNGKKHVMQGTYHADRLVSGALEVWRPVALVE
eukprot:TRINITY_DN5048_c0_g1_i1.p1 TRINITY_DN5048_c0_g1~~TRINITY_DN5048_c0_g1_i1.p1  ORF type:complete len:372 (+),score=21.23 TRINITY_DN5048_c0_g1_i1:193-1308(+)